MHLKNFATGKVGNKGCRGSDIYHLWNEEKEEEKGQEEAEETQKYRA